MKVISVKNVEVTSTQQQTTLKAITTPLYTPVVLPNIAITTQIKTDKKLETVVNQIQKIDTKYTNVLPLTTQVQPLS